MTCPQAMGAEARSLRGNWITGSVLAGPSTPECGDGGKAHKGQ